MATFEDHARDGNPLGALRTAIAYGSLWAIGSSFANSIHEITRVLFSDSEMDIIIAEVLATGLTTAFGVTIAVLALRDYQCCRPAPPPPAPAPPRPLLARR